MKDMIILMEHYTPLCDTLEGTRNSQSFNK